MRDGCDRRAEPASLVSARPNSTSSPSPRSNSQRVLRVIYRIDDAVAWREILPLRSVFDELLMTVNTPESPNPKTPDNASGEVRPADDSGHAGHVAQSCTPPHRSNFRHLMRNRSAISGTILKKRGLGAAPFSIQFDDRHRRRCLVVVATANAPRRSVGEVDCESQWRCLKPHCKAMC